MTSKSDKIALVIFIVVIGIATVTWAANHIAQYAGEHTKVQPSISAPDVYSLWVDTNNERIKHNLSPLALNQALEQSSEDHCADMVSQNYYAHTNPQGKTPRDFMQKYFADSLTTYYTGENIGAGEYPDAESITNAWIASPDHEANIVNPHYTQVGFAVCHSNNSEVFGAGTIVVEEFLGK